MSDSSDTEKQHNGAIRVESGNNATPAKAWFYVMVIGSSIGLIVEANQNAHPPQKEQNV